MPRLPDTRTLMAQLIGTPSVSCVHTALDMQNQPVCERLANWLDGLGFHTCLHELPGQPGKTNLIATLGEGPGLLLSGHTDTVPCDPDLWQSDPFKLTERDGLWFGLGTCDMKGFFVSALEAVADTLAQGRPLRKSLTIIATADEETSMNGARALEHQIGSLSGCQAIIGEPTGLRPVHLHKGMMMNEARLLGQSGHSSNPAYGKNALEAMHKVIGTLLAIRTEWQARWHDDRFEVPVPTLNLGSITGGDNPNRICGHCRLDFDTRPVPGMPLAELTRTLENRLGACAKTHEVQFVLQALMQPIEPFDNTGSGLADELAALGCAAPISVAYATEAPFFQQLGCDTLVLGPGDIRHAHQPDERIDPAAIQSARHLLHRLIDRVCLEGTP